MYKVDNRLSTRTIVILLYLRETAINGVVTKNKKEIAKEHNTTRQTVIRAIGQLLEYGYIDEMRDLENQPSIIKLK